jgi:hypothetical protein
MERLLAGSLDEAIAKHHIGVEPRATTSGTRAD